jgi:hypothetical protein
MQASAKLRQVLLPAESDSAVAGWPMQTTIAAYRAITQNYARVLDQAKSDGMAKRETAYYLQKIGSITSIDEFMRDSRVFNYAMRAYGLDDLAYAKGFMRKALEGGVDDSDSFANRLADTRIRDFVADFNFDRYGAATTTFGRTQQGTVDKYMRQQVETTAGQSNEAIRLAMYFERKAPDVKSAYGILADKALLKVAMTALNLPTAFSAYDIDKQASIISTRLKIADLKDAAKLKTFIERFATMWDLSASAASQTTVVSLAATSTGLVTMSTDLLAAVQSQFKKIG